MLRKRNQTSERVFTGAEFGFRGFDSVAGNMTAYSEMVWGPSKGLNHGADMQWGGGSLFVSQQEKRDEKKGTSPYKTSPKSRRLSTRSICLID